MSYHKKILISVILVIIAITVAYTAEAYAGIARINNKVIRLHVVANSNTDYDQQLKYKVRNQIINKFDMEFEDVYSKNVSERMIVEKIDEIREEAEATVRAEGNDYDVNVYYGNFKFPRKLYDDIVLPEGYYDAVRIEIGSAQGNNWWCVMFPPLCFVDFGKDKNAAPVFDVQTEKRLQDVLTQEEIEAIKMKRGIEDIKLKSAIFEFIEKGKIGNTGIDSDKTSRIYAESLAK